LPKNGNIVEFGFEEFYLKFPICSDFLLFSGDLLKQITTFSRQ